MIQIDLLSRHRQSDRPRRPGFLSQPAWGAGLALVVLGGMGWWSWHLHHEYDALLKEKIVKEAEWARVKEKSRETEKLETTYSTNRASSHPSHQPTDKSFASVRLLDSLSRSLDPLALWLIRLGVAGKEVEIEGRSWKGEDITNLVDRLEQTPPWGNLLVIKIRKESYQRVPVYHFNLRFALDG